MAYIPEGRSRAKKRAAALLDCFEQSRKQSEKAIRYSKADYDGSRQEEG